jgi:hypothetical protein
MPAQALPLHRITAGIRYNSMHLKVIPKTLTASQASAWIASRARLVAQRTRTMGWCYKAVKGALKPFGILLKGGAAWMAKEQLEGDDRFITTSLDDLKPGDILVHGKSEGHPYGHIAVYLGNEEEASDHVQPLITGEAYGGTTVFRLKAPVNFMTCIACK